MNQPNYNYLATRRAPSTAQNCSIVFSFAQGDAKQSATAGLSVTIVILGFVAVPKSNRL